MALLRYRGVREAEPDTVVIWRYMDWWKFQSMICTDALFFARADKQTDPWEGRAPDSTYEHSMLRSVDGGAPDELLRQYGTSAEEIISEYRRTHDKQRCFALLNCWHVHPTESLRMWEAYTSDPSAVAIETTVGDLKHCLGESPDGPAYLGFVSYLAREEAYLPIDGTLLPYFRKEPVYAFERELRALRWNCPNRNVDEVDWAAYETAVPMGAFVRVDLGRLIRSVRLLPNAPAGLRDEIVKLLRRRGIDHVAIQQSVLPFGPPAEVRRVIGEEREDGRVRNLLGDRGLLGLEEYDIVVDDSFRKNFPVHCLDDEQAKDTLLKANAVESLAPALEGPGNTTNYSLFLRAGHEAPSCDYSVIALTLRLGAKIIIRDGWRLYHNEFPLDTRNSPLEALQALGERYGHDLMLRGTNVSRRLLVNERVPAIQRESMTMNDFFVSWDRSTRPDGHKLKGFFHYQQWENGSETEIALGMLLDITAYTEHLERNR